MFKRTVFALAISAVLGTAQAAPVCQPSSYNVWLDVSGSMMLPQENGSAESDDGKDVPKIAHAKVFLKKLAQANQGESETGIFTVAPFTIQQEPAKLSAEEYARLLDEKIPENLESVGRMTWLGERAKAQLSREKHLVLVTDGDFSKWKQDSKVPAKKAFDAFRAGGGKLTVLSLAGNDEEVARLHEVFGESDIVDLVSVLRDVRQTDQVVERILDRRCTPAEAPVLELQGINFDFDKATLTSGSSRILDEALNVIRLQYAGRKMEIVGWTDSAGSDAYNGKLSLARAETVKRYFAGHGVDPERMTVRGAGKSFAYDNGTAHGRWMNRRVDIRFPGK